jgi:hypothetical protein
MSLMCFVLLAPVLPLQFTALQFSFINREDLPHGAAEFSGWFLDLMNRSRHVATLTQGGARAI